MSQDSANMQRRYQRHALPQNDKNACAHMQRGSERQSTLVLWSAAQHESEYIRPDQAKSISWRINVTCPSGQDRTKLCLVTIPRAHILLQYIFDTSPWLQSTAAAYQRAMESPAEQAYQRAAHTAAASQHSACGDIYNPKKRSEFYKSD